MRTVVFEYFKPEHKYTAENGKPVCPSSTEKTISSLLSWDYNQRMITVTMFLHKRPNKSISDSLLECRRHKTLHYFCITFMKYCEILLQIKIAFFYRNIFLNVINSCCGKAEFWTAISKVLHDASEITWIFGAQETLLSILKTVVPINVFVKTLKHFFSGVFYK